MRFLTLSQCCCGMENGGQRGWDDPCTPCPLKGTGGIDLLFTSRLKIRSRIALSRGLCGRMSARLFFVRCSQAECEFGVLILIKGVNGRC